MKRHSKQEQLPLAANVDIHCHVILWKPKEASFYTREGDKLFDSFIIPNHATIHARTALCLLVSLILSIIILLKHVPKISLRHVCNTLTTLYETSNWHWPITCQRLTYHSTTDRFLSALCIFVRRPPVWKSVISSPFPLSMVKILTMTHYLPYTLSWSSEAYSNR